MRIITSLFVTALLLASCSAPIPTAPPATLSGAGEMTSCLLEVYYLGMLRQKFDFACPAAIYPPEPGRTDGLTCYVERYQQSGVLLDKTQINCPGSFVPTTTAEPPTGTPAPSETPAPPPTLTPAPTPAPTEEGNIMATLVTIDHETGNLTQYASTSTDGGKLSASSASALVGAYGMQAAIDNTTDKYGQWNASSTKATLRYRLYVDPNGVSMANNASVWILRHYNSTGGLLMQCRIFFDGTNYSASMLFYNDAGASVLSDSKTITDAPHYIEFKIVSAATDSSADGTVEWWVDGVSEGSAGSVDNYNRMNDTSAQFRIGAMGISAATSGTIFLDDFVVNDDGGEIGPAITAKPAFLFYQ